jgi:tRNA pseudouridine55 synthase
VHSEGRKEFLLPLLTSLRDIAVIAVSEADAGKLKQGQSVSPKFYDVNHLINSEVAAVYNGELMAIVRIDEHKIAPVRVFNY